MRYNLRIASAATLLVFFFLSIYLYATDNVPSILSRTSQYFQSLNSNIINAKPGAEGFWNLASSGGSSSNPQAIKALWNHWSRLISNSRPLANPIALTYNAPATPLQDGDEGSREPHLNLVTNPTGDIEDLKTAHATFVQLLQSENFPDDAFGGTGIVTVGGGEYFGPAIIGIHMLRKNGCKLPVEVFVADESEFEPDICDKYLSRYNARCVILTDFLHDKGAVDLEVTHYQLKSLAMLFSSFAELLYLDSDSIPLINPTTELFSQAPYTTAGLVIWPDFWIATESPLYYSIAGIPSFPPNLPKTSSEAGQLLINKNTHLKSLLLAVYYNIYGPDFYYPLLSQGVLGQGDKETFMAAALVMNETFYRVHKQVTSLGRKTGPTYKGSGMTQYHPGDDSQVQHHAQITIRPAFIHANTPKMNAGHLVDEGDLVDAVDATKRLRLWDTKEKQEEVFGFDVEREVWSVLVETGCELEGVLGEWVGRERVCERLWEHWVGVFEQKKEGEEKEEGGGAGGEGSG